MKTRACFGFVLATIGMGLLLPLVSDAGGDPTATPEDVKKAERQENYIKDLMMAYRLKELGMSTIKRGKGKVEYTSPEAMVTAAHIFLDLAATPTSKLEIQPTIESENGSGVDKEDSDVNIEKDLQNEAKELLATARKASKDQNLNLEKIIKQVEDATRGAIGGPKNINRKIGGRDTHVYHIAFAAHIPASVGFQAGIPIRVTVVRTGNDNVIAAGINTRGVCNWFPDTQFKGKAAAGAPIRYTIRVHNLSKTPTQYRLFSN